MFFRLIKAGANFLNQIDHIIRPVSCLLLAAVFFFLDCSGRQNRFNPTDYFPIHPGYKWVFNGEIYKMQITDVSKEVGDKLVTFTYYDSLDVELWEEQYNLIKGQIYLHAYEPKTKLLPTVSFDPPLPFAPYSTKVGQSDNVECIETQVLDTLITTNQITVDYLIEAIEDVEVPAGHFLNCIRMKINVKYPQNSTRPFFIGDQYWWFAPRVGPVKYDLPTASGELIEMPNIKAWQTDISLN